MKRFHSHFSCGLIFCFSLQDPEKEVSDWLSDLTLVDQHPDLEVDILFESDKVIVAGSGEKSRET